MNDSIHSSNIYLASIKKILTNLSQNLANLIQIEKTQENILEKAHQIAKGNAVGTCSTKYLLSIFDGLKKSEGKSAENYWDKNTTFNYHFQPLSVAEKDFFPTKDTPQYLKEKLIQDFENELKILTSKYSNNILAENVFNLCEKYLVNIPSPYDVRVSLFDFLKVQTAAAICLAQSKESEGFLVIGADISGIQNFLFDIVSNKASSNLKGRSLYLQLLPELVLHRILQDLNLFAPNVLYASGGGFTILAANTTANISKLKNIRTEISKALFEAHGIGLYLELEWQEASFEDVRIKAKDVLKKLKSEKMAAQKRHKFSEQILKINDFFEPREVGGEQLRDAVTGEELNGNDKDLFDLNLNRDINYHKAKEKEDSQPIKALTKYLMKQGEYLEEKKFLVIRKADNGLQPFEDIGFIYAIQDHIEGGYVFKISELENLNYFPDNLKSNTIYGFEFYGGNDFPKLKIKEKSNKVAKTYSELGGQNGEILAQENSKILTRTYDYENSKPNGFVEPKFKRLGVLRMDVDGLGSVFINGFQSLVHYSTLSRSLDYFFKGYLNTIWATKTFGENVSFKDWLQIVYAGGDDIFVVGRWDAAIEFAKVVREDFKKFVCYNPNFGISGGVSLVTPKFPVIKAAKYADDAESAAKAYNCGGELKNAFSMMGVTMNWDKEFPLVQALKNDIFSFVYNKHLPVSFIYKVINFYEIARNPENMRWRWQMAYDFARMKERIKGNLDAIQFLSQLITWAITQTPPSVSGQKIDIQYIRFFKLLYIACIWASYELRNKS